MNIFEAAKRIGMAAVAIVAVAACATSPDNDTKNQFASALNSNTTVTPDASSYTTAQPINVVYTGMPPTTTGWIALAVPGSDDTSMLDEVVYNEGAASGTATFTNIPAGTYEARAYYDSNYNVEARSAPFTVTQATVVTPPPSGTTLNVGSASYTTAQTISVEFGGMPATTTGWIALAVPGSSDYSMLDNVYYNNGAATGTATFTGVPAGTYEARAYYDNNYNVEARTPSFTVTQAVVTTPPDPTTISTSASTYTSVQSIVVNYAGMPDSTTGWIALAVAGSPDTDCFDVDYNNGQASGTDTYANLAPGTYEARAYYDSSYNVYARTTFTVTSSTTCQAPASVPVMSSLTSGDLVVDATQTTNIAPIDAPLGTSILFTSLNENEPSPAYGGVMCALQAADPVAGTPAGVMCHRQTAGTDNPSSTGNINVHWTVVTFSSGVTVQRGTADTNVLGNPATITLSPAVDLSSSFVLVGGEYGGGTGWGNNEFAMAHLASSTSLQIGNQVAGSTIGWQVVTMTGASVQRGQTDIDTVDLERQVKISPAPSGSIALASYTTDNASGIAAGALMVQTSLLDTTTIDFKRTLPGAEIQLSWEVASLPFTTYAGTFTMGAGVSSATATVAGLDPTTTVAFSGSEGILGEADGSTSYSGSGTGTDLLGEAAGTLVCTANTVTVTRATSNATSTIPWQAIDFSHDCAGN